MSKCHHHFWVAHEGYDQCFLCGKVKIQGQIYGSLFDFVLKFVQNNFLEIFEPREVNM